MEREKVREGRLHLFLVLKFMQCHAKEEEEEEEEEKRQRSVGGLNILFFRRLIVRTSLSVRTDGRRAPAICRQNKTRHGTRGGSTCPLSLSLSMESFFVSK